MITLSGCGPFRGDTRRILSPFEAHGLTTSSILFEGAGEVALFGEASRESDLRQRHSSVSKQLLCLLAQLQTDLEEKGYVCHQALRVRQSV
jgi:hypothetical protein